MIRGKWMHKSRDTDGVLLKEEDTTQGAVWKGEFGREYTDRNTLEPEALDALYRSNYGVTRTQINQTFLATMSLDTSFLEVGCNTGNQLLLLQQMGYSTLSGVELQPYALSIARRRVPSVSLKLGSALSLPYEDGYCDLVFTSGVLIHIAPNDLPHAMDEIHRCARTFIWGFEYYAPNLTEINYRSRNGLLWKTDFAQCYLERFPDLELVREQRLPYLESSNVDTVFLLSKKP
jgi:pseudaminic acid biosynthesis-associated methylase